MVERGSNVFFGQQVGLYWSGYGGHGSQDVGDEEVDWKTKASCLSAVQKRGWVTEGTGGEEEGDRERRGGGE